MRSKEEHSFKAGIDEVGNGSLAGPFVAAIVSPGLWLNTIEGLRDSKTLNRKQIRCLAQKIRQYAAGVGVGIVSASEYNDHDINVSGCLKLAYARALADLALSYTLSSEEMIILDGNVNRMAHDQRVETEVRADTQIPAVMAASIVARARSVEIMEEVATRYPGYGFEEHLGYRTKMHEAAIRERGLCPEHRWKFEAVQAILSEQVFAELGFVFENTDGT